MVYYTGLEVYRAKITHIGVELQNQSPLTLKNMKVCKICEKMSTQALDCLCATLSASLNVFVEQLVVLRQQTLPASKVASHH